MSTSVIFVLVYFFVFVNEFIIFSFFDIFVFVNENHTDVHVLILGEVCFQYCSKLLITKHWVMEIVRQRVPGHQANNRKCPATEVAVKDVVAR